jgi:flagellar biosynthesis protein FliR
MGWPFSPDLLFQVIFLEMCVFMRFLGLFIFLPFWSGGALPAPTRVTLILLLSLPLSLRLLSDHIYRIPTSDLELVVVLGGELLIGLGAGLIVRACHATAAGAGQIASMTMGLGFAQSIDPMTGANTTALGRLLLTFAGILFFTTDIHLLLLKTLELSFNFVPVGELSHLGSRLSQLPDLGRNFFRAAFSLSAPVTLAALLAYVVLAAISKVSPQINLFAIGFAITISAGIIVLYFAMPDILAKLSAEYQRLPADIVTWLRTGEVRQ